MQTISNFFKKFSNIKPTARVIKEAVLDILKDRNIPVTKDEIIYSGGVVYIKSNQIIKNEIFISKKDILEELKNKLNKETVLDIR